MTTLFGNHKTALLSIGDIHMYVAFDSDTKQLLSYGKTYLDALNKASKFADETISCLPLYRVSIRQSIKNPSLKLVKIKRLVKPAKLTFTAITLNPWGFEIE